MASSAMRNMEMKVFEEQGHIIIQPKKLSIVMEVEEKEYLCKRYAFDTT